ncbi:MAG: hypothetical protein M3N53_02725 [Actinomycetota bacterium]|nr:hypothetical protein [Actinomycetota bacterium]
MQLDSRLRQGLIGTADAVDVLVERDLACVRTTVRHRRRQRIRMMVVVGAAVAVTVASLAPQISSVGFGVDDLDLPPVDRSYDQLDEDQRYRLELPRLERSLADRRGAIGGVVQRQRPPSAVPSQRRRPPSAAPAAAGPVDPKEKEAAAGAEAPPPPSRHGDRSRHASEAYQMPVVRQDFEPRSQCAFLRDGCAPFEVRPEDGFLRIAVRDDSGAPALVRITQWDRHGTVGDPTIYCGGTSETVVIFPTTVLVTVHVEEGNCAGEDSTRPAGGWIEAVFSNE